MEKRGRGVGLRRQGTSWKTVSEQSAHYGENLPDFLSVRDADRVRGALEAIEKHRADTLVLDDGFQHRRLHRDADVVLLATPIRWGQASSLYFKMAERLNAGSEFYRLTAVAPSAQMMVSVMDRMFGSPKASLELEVTQAPTELSDDELAAGLVALLDKLKKPDDAP